MKLVFLETPLFTRLLGDYMTDESYRELQRALMENPEMGDLMPGTGGLRKDRREDARRGKGKRGGLRASVTTCRPITRFGSSQSLTGMKPPT